MSGVAELGAHRSRRVLDARLSIAHDFQLARDARDFTERLAKTTLPGIFDCAACSIFLVNEARDRLNNVATTGIRNLGGRGIVWYKEGDRTTGRIWADGKVRRLLPGDKAIAPGPKSRERLARGVAFQMLALPMIHEAQVVGVVRMVGKRDNNPFSLDEEELARELSEELGALFVGRAAADRERQYGQALSRLGELLQHETDHDTALRLLLTAITSGKGLGFNRAAIWLSDTAESHLEPAFVVGYRNDEKQHEIWEKVDRLSLDKLFARARRGNAEPQPAPFAKARIPLSGGGKDILRECFAGRYPRRAVRASKPPVNAPGDRAIARMFGRVQFAVAPLSGNPRCQGVIYVDNAVDRKPIDDLVIEQLQKFAHLGGLAIERIREATWRKQRGETHENLTAAIVADPSLEPRAKAILNVLRDGFQLKRWLLYHYDHKAKLVSVLSSLGFEEVPHHLLTFDVDREKHAITPRVVRQNKLQFFDDGAKDKRISRYWRKTLKLKGPVLVYPIHAGRTVHGVLVVNDEALTRAHIKRLAEFDNDLAIAVSIDGLYRGLGQRNKVLDVVQRTQTAFARAFTDENWFLHELAYRIRDITQASLCAIYRISPRTLKKRPIYRRVVALGYPNPEYDDDRVAAEGRRAGLANHVLAGRNVISKRVDKDRRWQGKQRTEIEGRIGPYRTLLGVPIRVRSTGAKSSVGGAIVLTRGRHTPSDGLAFQKADEAPLEAVATAVSSYLTLMDAWHELGTQLAALQGLYLFGQELHGASWSGAKEKMTDEEIRDARTEPVFHAIAKRALEMFKADVVAVFRGNPTSTENALTPAFSGSLRHTENSLEALRTSTAALEVAKRRRSFYEPDIGKSRADGMTDKNSVVEPLLAQREGILAFAAVPIIGPRKVSVGGQGEIEGVLFIEYRTPYAFTSSERLAIEAFASYAGLAVHSAKGIFDLMRRRESEFHRIYLALNHSLGSNIFTLPEALKDTIRHRLPNDLKKELSDLIEPVESAIYAIRGLGRLTGSYSDEVASVPIQSLMEQLRDVVAKALGREGRVEFNVGKIAGELNVDPSSMADDFKNFASDSLRHFIRKAGAGKVVARLGCREATAQEIAETSEKLQQSLSRASYLRITYADNGPGIEQGIKEVVFNEHYSTAPEGRGMGIGLTIARLNANRHDGAILECGTPGKGVLFALYLPNTKKDADGKGISR